MVRLFEEFKQFESTAKDFCKANGVMIKLFIQEDEKCSDLVKI